MTVYIEDLLIIECLINVLLVYIACCIANIKASIVRIIMCSIIGALSILIPQSYKFIAILIKFSLLILYSLILNIEHNSRQILKTMLALVLSTNIIGIITLNIFNSFNLEYEIKVIEICVTIVALVIAVFIKSIIKMIVRQRRVSSLMMQTKLKHNGKAITLKGYLDTGNTLASGGKPIVVVNKDIISKLGIDRLSEIITIKTVNGIKVKQMYIIEEIDVCEKDNIRHFTQIGAIVSDTKLSKFDVILNSTMLD